MVPNVVSEAFNAVSGIDPGAIKVFFAFVAYFLLLAACLTTTYARALKSLPYTFAAWIFTPISLIALYATWSHIYNFLYKDFQREVAIPLRVEEGRKPTDDEIVRYLIDADWFNAAYAAVAKTPYAWWWSVQLLNTAAVIVAWMWSEGAHHWARRVEVRGGPGWIKAGLASAVAYALVGILGAMSVAFALFCVQREAIERSYVLRSSPRLTPTIWLLTALYLLGVAYTPHLDPALPLFSLNLKLYHLALILPVLGAAGPVLVSHPKQATYIVRRKPVTNLYLFLAIANFASYVVATYPIAHHAISVVFNAATSKTTNDTVAAVVSAAQAEFGHLGQELYRAIFINNAETSITVDLVFCTAVALVLIFDQLRKGFSAGVISGVSVFVTLLLTAITTVVGGGVSVFLPAFLAWREGWYRYAMPGGETVVVETTKTKET
ncbi:hypothetical protein DFS34DRAFT_357483 [Phlyctochytrium arcticum]|nr:hypothetical protein DFS34DRAFT_357483 [Phlyctochytrium arcticum]